MQTEDRAGEADGLRANHLAKAFKGRQVVKDVSLHLRRGEIAGLLGPNGAGKTTCFYIMMGLIHADEGSVTIDGEDVTGLPMYQRARLGVGYLPQENSIFRGMTVYENVMSVAELTEKTPAKRRELTETLLEELQIAHLGASATRLGGFLLGRRSIDPSAGIRLILTGLSYEESLELLPGKAQYLRLARLLALIVPGGLHIQLVVRSNGGRPMTLGCSTSRLGWTTRLGENTIKTRVHQEICVELSQ
jgi:ABC-type glutathione transport system ATPase component